MRGRGHRGQGGGRRHRSRRRRIRLLEPVLLLKLLEGPAHGYSLIEEVAAYGLGDVQPSALYRSLRVMEERGLIQSTWDEEDTQGPPRRMYSISPKGEQMLGGWAEELEEAKAHIDRLLDGYRGS